MPTWASADRTVQRGCEPKAIKPPPRRVEERGRFLVRAILAQNGIFSIRTRFAGISPPTPRADKGPAWLRAHARYQQNRAPRSARSRAPPFPTEERAAGPIRFSSAASRENRRRWFRRHSR